MGDRKQELVESTRNSLLDLDHAADYLASLSRSFAHVGNEKVADNLSIISRDIRNAAKTIRGNRSEELSIELRESQQSTARMLCAALVGATGKDATDG